MEEVLGSQEKSKEVLEIIMNKSAIATSLGGVFIELDKLEQSLTYGRRSQGLGGMTMKLAALVQPHQRPRISSPIVSRYAATKYFSSSIQCVACVSYYLVYNRIWMRYTMMYRDIHITYTRIKYLHLTVESRM